MGRTKEWTDEEVKLLQELRPHNTMTQVKNEFEAQGFKRSRVALERKSARLGVFYVGPQHEPNDEVEEVPDQFSEALDKIMALKREYTEDHRHRLTGVMPKDKATRKILTLSDFHIPFDRHDLVRDIVDEHADDTDILVVNGDMFDLHAVSTWPKEKSVILKREYEIAMEYLKVFSQKFPAVVLVRGNHEYRLNRYFHSNMSKSVSFLVDKEILGRLRRGERYDDEGNVIESNQFDNVIYQNGAEAWYVKIGKSMFLHPMSFSKVEGKTAVNAQDYFMEREDIDCVVLGHTHHMAKIPVRNKLCIEQGCLCCPLDYEKQGKLNFKAMTLGYAVIYQDEEGNCDFNRSTPIYLGTQYSDHKPIDDILDKMGE